MKFLKIISVAASMILAVVASGCVEEKNEEPLPRHSFTMEEARAIYARAAASTRSVTFPRSALYVMPPGTITPQWDRADTSSTDLFTTYEMPVAADFEYASVAYDTVVRDLVLTPLQRNMIVLRCEKLQIEACYLLYFIPDREKFRSEETAGPRPLLTNLGPKGDFTGLALYTSLDGVPLGAIRYRKGQIARSVFVADNYYTLQDRLDLVDEVIDQLAVYPVKTTRAFPGGSGNMNDGIDINDIVVVAPGNGWRTCPEWDEFIDRNSGTLPLKAIGAPGGGGGGVHNPAPPPPPDQNRCKKCGQIKCVCPRETPCTPQAEANSAASHEDLALLFRYGFDALLERIKGNPWVEHGYVLNYDVRTQSYAIPSIITGITNSITLTAVYDYSGAYTVTYIHYHPSDGPPSRGDALNLGMRNSLSNGGIATSFIYTASGTYYSLYVEDRALAERFYKNNNSRRKELGGEYDDLFKEMWASLGNTLIEEAQMYVLAYMLELYDSGIRVLRDNGNGFRQAAAKEKKDGSSGYDVSICH